MNFTLAYRLLDEGDHFHEPGFGYTDTLGWNLDAEGVAHFLADNPGARFVIGVRA